EDFDGVGGGTTPGTYSFPSGWFLRNVDNKTPNTNVSYVNEAWERREDFADDVTDSCAFSTSWYTPAGAANDFMWTPAITLPTGTINLSWNAVTYDASYPDGYEVRIMTVAPTGGTGVIGNQLTNSTVLFSTAAENTTWTNRTVSLNAYAGQTVYIGWRNNSNDQFLLLIDDVIVEKLTPINANLDSLGIPSEYFIMPNNQRTPLSLVGKVINSGTNTLSNVQLKVNVFDFSDNLITTLSSSSLASLASGSSNVFTISPYTLPSGIESYYYQGYVTHSVADNVTSNDSAYYFFPTIVDDSTYSRDVATITGSLGIGAGNGGYLGNQFTVVNNDNLSSISLGISSTGLRGKIAACVWNMSGGKPNAIIAITDTITLSGASSNFFSLAIKGGPLAITPGEYVVTAIEIDSTLGLGTSADIFTLGKTWVNWPTNPNGDWSNSEDFGFIVSYIIRPNFGCSTPTAAITAGGSTTFCSGGSVTLSATTGTGYNYQWKKDGANVGTNSPTYSATAAGAYTCVVTNACGNATSNSISVTVNPNVAASVSIAPTATNICAGTNVTFTATPTNGGTTPSYQWKLNGANVGTNSATYSNAALANGNTVSCVMTSNATCATGSPATSNVVTMTVNPNVAASVSIVPTATNICAGTNVTFTATPTNGGTTPSYQWKLNGANVGTNSATYSNAALANGNTVSCVMTSNATCATGSPATSNVVTMTVNPNVAASVSIVPTATNICAGTNVTFTATPTNGGTTPSYQWKLNGANVGTNSATYSNAALANGNTVSCVMTSNATCATGSPATSNVVTMTVNPNVAASVSIVPTATNVCAGTNVTFTATPTNGGTTPSYQWKLNGANVGTNSATYSNASLTNGQTVTCVMTSNAACVTGSPATSNAVAITVNPILTPSVSIAANANPICPGTNVTFTATPTNGGTTPSYQWKLNGSNVGTNSATYSNASLVQGDVVSCVMTSNALCASTSTATSNTVTMTVTANPPASVSIVASNNPTCAGTSVTFTATPINGGTPTYQWKLNGGNVGTNSATYSNSGLATGDLVSCVMTSSLICVTGSPATSNTVTMTVNPNVAASVSIAPTATNVCAGTNVTFTATPTNGGSTPAYQWKLNGGNVGSNSATYSNASLANGDAVTCVMTSNAQCVTGSPATSNMVTMTVNPNVPASVSIAPTATNVCAGTNVTFTATPTNGGSTPAYQWKLNGGNVGSNSATYSNASLANGDAVTCVMTSNAQCVTGSPATSNMVTMTVNPNVAASVSIAPTATNVCAGTNVTFTATPTNGGSTPAYQWKLNGGNVGSNSATYSNASLANGDAVTCVMTSNAQCVTGSPATSNAVTMTINPNLPVSVVISADDNSVCAGTAINFTATPTNGGTIPAYQWKVNGSNVGTNSATYSNATLANGDLVTCVLTSNANCATGNPATSNTVTATIFAIPAPVVNVNGNILTSSVAGDSYQWFLNGTLIPSATSQSYTATESGNYSVAVTTNGCTGTSAAVNVTVSGIIQQTQFQRIDIFPNPNNGFMKVVIETPKGGDVSLMVYDVLGKLVAERNITVVQGRNQLNLDLSELSQNIYFIQTKMNDQVYQGKVIIAE
ncbi:MAG: choice-of-anchor J domain-containing protein, partial [Chitinophagales bacterium]|nr:choice-of-anchor J domain-containing protein [Chitinophagales bacterium]